MIVSVLARKVLVDGQVRALFQIGQIRLDRIRAQHPELPRVSGAYTVQQKADVVAFVLAIESEAGFACAHRHQREYLRLLCV